MKHNSTKLALRSETVRHLARAQLSRAVGGSGQPTNVTQDKPPTNITQGEPPTSITQRTAAASTITTTWI
jgi:hypothetical protein